MPTLDPKLFAACPPETLPNDLIAIIESLPMPSLGDGPACADLAQWLRSRRTLGSGQPTPLAAAGLWLLAGDLEASHAISQSDERSDASFWHAVMHRREGDFSNAKYWFRRVGHHPVLAELARTAYGDPMQFVDRCERVTGKDQDRVLVQCQWDEWQRLFAHCLAAPL
jgi:hypothetical protein